MTTVSRYIDKLTNTSVPDELLIEKLQDINVDTNILIKEFDKNIKKLLEPKPKDFPIQLLYHLILDNKISSISNNLPYTLEIIEKVRSFFNFKDVTYRSLQPTRTYDWHSDKGKTCIHIPMITNKGCRFVYDKISFFMPADGSVYKVNNIAPHTFINAGSITRVHLMFENLF